jgi:hypothetical protein
MALPPKLGCVPNIGLVAITLGILVLLAFVLNAFLRRYPKDPGMPLASTCSMAISSNCHRPDDDTEAHLLPVQWGVCTTDNHGRTRCAFTTSRYVKPPKIGEEIFGLSKGEGGEEAKRLWYYLRPIRRWRVRNLVRWKRSHKD